MKKKYKITKAQALEIRAVLKQYEKTSAFRKLQVIMLRGEGKSGDETAQITAYHPTYIRELVKQFCTQSFSEFVKDNRGGVRRKNLTDEQEQKIVDKFKEKAIAGQVVNLSDVRAEYETIWGKKAANSTFYRFLHRVKWRRVMPRGAHPKKASEAEIEASKKLTFS